MKNLMYRITFFFREDLKPWRLKARITGCWRGRHILDHYIGKNSLHFVGSCLICHKRFTRSGMAKLQERYKKLDSWESIIRAHTK